MNRLIFLVFLTIWANYTVAQVSDISINTLSSSLANDEVVYTLGDIHIDDTSGALGSNSFQLFYELGVNVETLLDTDFKVFPNPAESYISVESIERIETIRLFDMYGKEIISTKESSDIDLSNVASGFYIIIINDKQAVRITKH